MAVDPASYNGSLRDSRRPHWMQRNERVIPTASAARKAYNMVLQQETLMTTTNPYQACIDACNACVIACNECFAGCLQEDDPKMMARCIALDADCAAICSLAVGAMARNSEMAKHFCRLCSEVCLACANECAHHPHDHCVRCAEACRACSKACLAMVN